MLRPTSFIWGFGFLVIGFFFLPGKLYYLCLVFIQFGNMEDVHGQWLFMEVNSINFACCK